jgi:secreted trypsin-like serine protease
VAHALNPRKTSKPAAMRDLDRSAFALAAGVVALAMLDVGCRATTGPATEQPERSRRVALTKKLESAHAKNWMREHVHQKVAMRNFLAMSGRADPVSTVDLRKTLTPWILGGGPANGRNPFQVALLDRDIPNNSAAQYCGGSLIRGNIVVTAAHCSNFVRAAQVQVLTGTEMLDGSGTRHDVERITIHPRYNSTSMESDVAVWRLANNAENQSLATLALDDGEVGSKLWATGWGALIEGGSGPVQLQSVEVPLVDRQNCNDANSYDGQISERMLCAGFDAGGEDACEGDSGGPLARGSVLVGITSWGTGCGRPNLFGVYTRVSDPSIRSFIKENL